MLIDKLSVLRTVKRIVLIGNYPSRQCGIATFTHDLHINLKLLLPTVEFAICAMNESVLDTHAYPPEVLCEIDQEDESSYERAAAFINEDAEHTVVIVQHEYGIYGGVAGELLLVLLDKIECPIITTLHTITARPTEQVRNVTRNIIKRSHKLIVLTDDSLRLFTTIYPEAKGKTERILHGIHPVLYKNTSEMKPKFKLQDKRVMMTFGLLSRNKGIEYILAALPDIKEQIPNIMYLIVGGTHPGVLRHEGESYRLELMKQVLDLGLKDHVRFMDDFLPVQDILEYLQAADIYVATSLDPEQAVSGTLSYALGTGRAVIATSFAQAKEVVGNSIGRIVPIRDSKSVANAAIELFADTHLLEEMSRAAYSATRSMLWANVADEYLAVIAELSRSCAFRWPELETHHLGTMTDSFGMLQFSDHRKPKRSSGYTLDDNSRALQFVCVAYDAQKLTINTYSKLSNKFIQVIESCLTHNPPVNYLSATTKQPTTQNTNEDLSDSLARAFFALQTIKHSNDTELSEVATRLLELLPINLFSSNHIKTTTQLLFGACTALESGDNKQIVLVEKLSKRLIDAYAAHSDSNWKWFEGSMTYANGQICAALIEAARITKNDELKKVGLESLEFLTSVCFMGDVYAPIGQGGWHSKEGSRALFDQQPEDAFSIMQALESAYKLTGDQVYIMKAKKVFSWFLGNNLIGARVYDDTTGGCHDGLTPSGVNLNQGAESTLSYLGARIIIERLCGEDAT